MARHTTLVSLLVLVALLAGCGYRTARFAPGPVIWRADDRRPTDAPRPRLSHGVLYRIEARAEHHVVQGMTVGRPDVAEDINRLDEVVASSWHRGSRAPMTLDGYRRDGPPQPPFLVVEDDPRSALLSGGVAVEDGRGRRYDLYFDPPGYPESRTAAWPIASRLVHALGYHTAETYVVEAMSGRRAVAVRREQGRDLGPTPLLWTRPDDPNDVIAHDARRTLRASLLWMKWMDVTRISPTTFRDVFVGPEGSGHVEHRVVDLASALGVARLDETIERATKPFDDDADAGWLLLSFGAIPIEPPPSLPATGRGLVGLSSAVASLRQDLSPPFGPHDHLRPDDLYWMARRLAALPDEVVAAAIEAGRISRAEERARVREVLGLRRAAVLRLAFAEVTPVRALSLRVIRGGAGTRLEVGFSDDERRWRSSGARARYDVAVFDERGGRLGQARVSAEGARFGVAVTLEDAPEVAILRLAKVRNGEASRPMEAHVDLATGRLRGVLH